MENKVIDKSETAPSALQTHNHRKIYKQIYQIESEKTIIHRLPKLKFVSQRMNTTFYMHSDGHPIALDEKWIAWKVVNQIKQITKKELAYKFKLMPREIVWHQKVEDEKWLVDKMLVVAECVTTEMFERAIEHVKKNLRLKELPSITFVESAPALCAQRLHIGDYKDTASTLQTLLSDLEKQGYRAKGTHREIYLMPGMECYPPEKCHTIVRVECEAID